MLTKRKRVLYKEVRVIAPSVVEVSNPRDNKSEN